MVCMSWCRECHTQGFVMFSTEIAWIAEALFQPCELLLSTSYRLAAVWAIERIRVAEAQFVEAQFVQWWL